LIATAPTVPAFGNFVAALSLQRPDIIAHDVATLGRPSIIAEFASGLDNVG
jgi:hypothetical protein